MAQAVPTSPWHPTSAPEIEALFFTRLPISPAVAKALITDEVVVLYVFWWYFNTAGITAQAPQVGAVTIRPPDAFSSETAKA
jgi:hypothetical protein